jgi:hypothetical protein
VTLDLDRPSSSIAGALKNLDRTPVTFGSRVSYGGFMRAQLDLRARRFK